MLFKMRNALLVASLSFCNLAMVPMVAFSPAIVLAADDPTWEADIRNPVNGDEFRATVQADSMSKAGEKFKAMYPGCEIGMITEKDGPNGR